jgi:hypothetical protein
VIRARSIFVFRVLLGIEESGDLQSVVSGVKGKTVTVATDCANMERKLYKSHTGAVVEQRTKQRRHASLAPTK